jgi:methylmalonyl-CoA mutase cobalamin-binding domain/chain
MTDLSGLGKTLVALEEGKFIAILQEKIARKENPMEIIQEINAGMVEVGKRFESGDCFISELVMCGKMFKWTMTYLSPLLGSREEKASKGIVVIGTVKDDIHDIGKNIVVTLLQGAGYQVVDLGVDVPSENFVKAVRESGARIVGLSALLSFTYPRMTEVVEALKKAGLRDNVTVIIGGSPCNEEVRRLVGADYYANHAPTGVRICEEIYGKRVQ